MPRGEGKGLGAGVGACGPEQGEMLKPRPRDCLGGCGFLCPTQQAALPVTAGMNWSITPCRISMPPVALLAHGCL